MSQIAVYSRLRELTLTNELENLSHRLDQEAHLLTTDLQQRTIEVQNLAASVRFQQAVRAAQQGDWGPAVAALVRARSRSHSEDDFIVFALALPDGTYATSLAGLTAQNIRDRPYFQAAMAGHTFLSPPYRSRSTGEILLNVSTPIALENEAGREDVAGVLISAFSENSFWQRFAGFRGEERYGWVVDKQGHVLFRGDGGPRHLPEAPQPSLLNGDDPALAAIVRKMVDNQTGVERWSPDGKAKYVAFQPLTGTDWAIALVVPAADIEQNLGGLNQLAALAALIWLVAAYLRGRQLMSLAKERCSAQALAEREQVLQVTIHNLAGVVYRCRHDEHWTTEFISDFVKTLTGYPATDFLENRQRTWNSLIHAEDRARVSEQVAAALQWRRPFDLEYRIIRADGEVRWVNDRGQGQWDAQDNLMALDGVLVDITARKATAQALQEALQEALALNAILENLAEGLLVLSVEGYILQTNQTLRTMYRLPESSILSGLPLERSPMVSLATALDWEAVRQGQEVSAEIPLPGQRIGRAVASRVLKLQDAHPENCLGMAVLVRDITVEHEVDKMKTDFIATVSHELRTPLTSVLGFAAIVQEKLGEEIAPALATLQDKKVDRAFNRVKANLDIITAEAERLTNLINDVLDIAKMEAGKIEWRMETLDLREIVDRALNATASLFERSGLACYRELPKTMPPVVGDRDRLIQVVVNLISNAVKFTNEGSVTSGIELRGDRAVLSVRDTGMGIAAEDCPKVFEKFKQVGDTLTDKPKGTGLGLSICKQIIEHHGGKIWVESELGRGSTFFFDLPLVSSSGSAPNLKPLLDSFRQQMERCAPTLPKDAKRILV
ncbi:MAG: ATP-binding protein, partial [Pseudanabaenaceae cyanobacterium]